MKKILLLGSSGFVGANLSQHFESSNVNFKGVSRKNGIDLFNPASISGLLEHYTPDCIVNCAAHVGSLNYVTLQAADVVVDNARMILNLYESVRNICPSATIVNPIANCAYPSSLDKLSEDYLWSGRLHDSVLSYGSTRRLLMSVSKCFQMQYNVRSISLLVPNMYGPHDSIDPNKAHALNALVSKFVKARNLNSEFIDIWGSGSAIREWLYAPDFAKVVSYFINNETILGLDEPVNVAQNFGLSVRELVNLIKKLSGYKGGLKFDISKPDGTAKKVMDDCKFRKVYPDFVFTELSQGIIETIAYYESIYPY
jgi:GDP-L-fucose synthase